MGITQQLKRPVERADRVQREHRTLAFPFAVFKKFGEDEAGALAALVAYYGFFSLFPLLLVLTTVLAYVLEGNEDLQRSIVDSTIAQFPVIGDQIEQNVQSLQGGLLPLVVGIIGALWAGLGALQAMQRAMNTVWDVPRKHRPNFVEKRLRALGMVGVLGLGVIGVALLGAMGTFSRSMSVVGTLFGLIGALALAVGVFLLAFKVLTDADLAWRDHLVGAVVAGVGFVALQSVGGYYVGRVVRGASQTYGFFAVVIGLLSWMYLLAQVALLAAEVNVVRRARLWPRSILGDDLTDADVEALRRHASVEERHHDEDVEATIDPDEVGSRR